MKKPLVVLTGPTAVGKTALSIKLAKAIGGEIISADSMQVYRYMDIGSAKITKEEMEGVPHHLIDCLDPEEEFHVVRFQSMVSEALDGIYRRGHIPILTGGTGFYIQAVIYDIDFQENGEDTAYRSELEALAKEKGDAFLFEMLRKVDPKSTETIHMHNRKRVIRALEYYHQTGRPISEHNEEQRKKESPYNLAYFVLNDDRAILYDRINRRVDLMMEKGLLAEVEGLKKRGCHKQMVSMQGLGYKELLAYLDGDCTLCEAVDAIKQETRHFAKRQITWFKREKQVDWFSLEAYNRKEEQILEAMLSILKDRQIWDGTNASCQTDLTGQTNLSEQGKEEYEGDWKHE